MSYHFINPSGCEVHMEGREKAKWAVIDGRVVECLNFSLADLGLSKEKLVLVPKECDFEPLDERILEYEGKHEGRKCFIIASGPSAKDAPIDKLGRYITIGVNRSGLLMDTTYIACMDYVLYGALYDVRKNGWEDPTGKKRKWADFRKLMKGKERKMFVGDAGHRGAKEKGQRGWWNVKDAVKLRTLSRGVGFSRNLARGVYKNFTTTLFALQIAVYMGCNPIYLVGADLKHKDGLTHFFGKVYDNERGDGVAFARMARAFENAAQELEGVVEVYNMSPITDLKCFSKCTWREALK